MFLSVFVSLLLTLGRAWLYPCVRVRVRVSCRQPPVAHGADSNPKPHDGTRLPCDPHATGLHSKARSALGFPS